MKKYPRRSLAAAIAVVLCGCHSGALSGSGGAATETGGSPTGAAPTDDGPGGTGSTGAADSTSGEETGTQPPPSGEACPHDGVCATLTVVEALPADTPGRARIAEHVTVGVPLTRHDSVFEVDQLALDGPDRGQFRELSRYPSGELRWVQVDFLADVDAGGSQEVDVVAGSGDFGGPPLATTADGSIEIDTGAAEFSVRLDRFGVLDTAMVAGVSQLSGPGWIYALSGGTEYRSDLDSSPTIAIEENGPVRCVVRAEGVLSSAQGAGHLGYTARVTFVAQSPRAQVEVTFRNASPDHLGPRFYDALGISLPLAVDDAITASIGLDSGEVVTGPVTTGAPARVLQEVVLSHPATTGMLDTSFGWPSCAPPVTGVQCLPAADPGTPDDPCRRAPEDACPSVCGDCEAYGFEFFPDAAVQGVEVRIGGNTEVSLGNEQAASYLRAQAGALDVTVAQRWMVASFPASTEVTVDGALDIGFYSRWSTRRDWSYPWGAHDTRAAIVDFGGGDPDAAHYALDFPLVAKASLEQYEAAGAFLGEHVAVSAEHEDELATIDRVPLAPDTPRFRVDRYEHWRRNYYARERAIYNFWRGRSAEFLLMARARAEFEMDAAIVHSDGFSLADHPEFADVTEGQRGSIPYDIEHQLTQHLPALYYATGNERIREAITDFGEDQLDQINRGHFPFPETEFYRAWLRRFENFVWLAEFTGDAVYEEKVLAGIDFLIEARADGSHGSRGRDLQRGFLYMTPFVDLYGEALGIPTASDHPRVSHMFFDAQIAGETLQRGMQFLRGQPQHGRLEDLEDLAVGYAQYLQLEVGSVGGEFLWVGTDYCIDPLPDPERAELQGLCTNSPVAAATPVTEDLYLWDRHALHLYDMFGDGTALSQAQAVFDRRALWLGTAEELSLPEHQALVAAIESRRPSRYALRPLSTTVERLPSGSYEISWTVPEGAQSYRFKYAEREIVDWLGFDPVSRTYEIDPTSHTAWFAASNFSDEPDPGSPGMEQSWIVEGLDPSADWHFSAHYSTTENANE